MTNHRDDMRTMALILENVYDEMGRQDAKWGAQSLPDGTGPALTVVGVRADNIAEALKDRCDDLDSMGETTWGATMIEEAFEVLAEDDPAKLDAELVQLVAVGLQWLADLRTRGLGVD